MNNVERERGLPGLPPAVYGLAGVAFALRLGVRLSEGADSFWTGGYTFFFALAQSLAAGRGFALRGVPTAIRVPLYPLVVAGLTFGHRAFWPIVAAQSAVGAGTVIAAAVLARDMFRGAGGRRAAVVAAGLVAVYPYYVVHDTALQETGLYTFLTVLCVVSLRQAAQVGGVGRGARAGLLLGLDVLTRATIVPVALLAPVWLAWRRHGREGAACALLMAVVVCPWLWRNYRLTGVPTLTTDAGDQVWAAQTAAFFRYYPAESSDRGQAAAVATLTDEDKAQLTRLGSNAAAVDHWFFRRAIDQVRSHPWQAAIGGLRKNAAAFGWLLSPRGSVLADVVYALSYGPVMTLGLWGMWRRRALWREDAPVYTLFAAFMLVTAAVWGHTSHRSHLDVYWMIFGAGAVAETVLPD